MSLRLLKRKLVEPLRNSEEFISSSLFWNRIVLLIEICSTNLPVWYNGSVPPSTNVHQPIVLPRSLYARLVMVLRRYKRGYIKPGQRVVTIVCDSGMRHLSKFWNDAYLASFDGLVIPVDEKYQTPLQFVHTE